MKGANIKMKKVILTISALLVSATMVFAFAGCTTNPVDEDPSNAVAGTVEDGSNAAVDSVTEADVTNA